MSWKSNDGGENLPPECWQLIFNRLDRGDLKTASLACKDFLTNSNFLKESLNVVHPNVSLLSQHLKRFTQLRKVDLSQFQGDLDEALGEVARSDISLESLDISHPKASFKIDSLRELGSNLKMKNLKALSLKWVSPRLDVMVDDYLRVIASSFPNLEELNLCSLSYSFYTDNGMEFLASKLKLLKKIVISGVDNVSDQFLVALSENCIFLKDFTLNLNSVTHSVTESGIGFLLWKRPYLEALWVGFVKIKDSSVQSSTITIANSISHAKALASLQFFGMDISDSLLMAIGKAKLPLENFGIIHCKKFTVAGLLMVLSSNLSKLSILGVYNFVEEDIKLLFKGDVGNLTHIDITGCRVTDSILLFLILNKCPSLVKITMKPRPLAVGVEINDRYNNVPLSKYYKIRHVHLGYFKISDELVKKFGFIFPNIKVLDLSFSNEVTSTGIEVVLKSCKSITELILAGYRKEKIIEPDSDLPKLNLEVLALSCSCIDNEGLAAIAEKCQRLVDLNLNFCKKVTTESIKHMVQSIKTLTHLHVWQCDQIDYGDLLGWMLSTGNLASLKKISIGAIFKITKEQRDQFLSHGCLLLDYLQW